MSVLSGVLADVLCHTCEKRVPADETDRCTHCRELHCDNELIQDEADYWVKRCAACVDLLPSGSLCDPSDEDRET